MNRVPKHSERRSSYLPAAGGDWRVALFSVMFRSETRYGRIFDIGLMIAIVISVIVVMLESMPAVDLEYPLLFRYIEWGFTALFTIEYILRLLCVRHPLAYARSFYGIVDLLAIMPTYLGFFAGVESLVVIRMLRLLRVFRLFKLTQFIGEAETLVHALVASRTKITVFLGAVGIVVVIVGTLMYLIEADAGSGFDSIPKSMYWAVVTMTTVGYGDIAPRTPLGSVVATMLMLAGYGIIAVPTGIVTAELVHPTTDEPEMDVKASTEVCPDCALEGHRHDAVFCRRCGAHLYREDPSEEPAAQSTTLSDTETT